MNENKENIEMKLLEVNQLSKDVLKEDFKVTWFWETLCVALKFNYIGSSSLEVQKQAVMLIWFYLLNKYDSVIIKVVKANNKFT